MIDKYKNLDKTAKIRILIYTLILLWCIFLAIYLSIIASEDTSSYKPLSTSDVNEVNIDGADFSWAVRLMGYGINGIMSLFMIVLVIAYMLLESVAVFIPILIFRLAGLRKTVVVEEDEYILTRNMYFIAAGLSLVLSLIVSHLVGIIPVILFTVVWALFMLIYVIGVKNRYYLRRNI